MYVWILAIFLNVELFVDLAVCNDERKHAIFEEIFSPASAKDTKRVTMFHKSFHQCGINDGCEFIAKNLQTNEFKKISKEEDLPEDRENHRIWIKKKIQDNHIQQNEGQPTNYAPTAIFGSESCKEVKASGIVLIGAAELSWGNGSTFKAPCDMTRDGGGWTVFQRRRSPGVDFDRDWNDYVRGFGNFNTGFWLGLEALHYLTKDGNVKLRIDLSDGTDDGHAEYGSFKVGDASSKYTITFSPSSISGNIGNALMAGKPFTTRDRDNDNNTNANCAITRSGGFWYDDQCDGPNLNGLQPGTYGSNVTQQMTWFPWKYVSGTIVLSEMKLRREN